jgi:steroid delta-isomerase-like uncharacterized protein
MHRWFDEVWNKGNASAIDEMMVEDAVVHGLGEADAAVRGPAAFKPFAARLRGAFPDIHVTIDDTIEEGDLIAARWTARMTHRGDHLGPPPTGRAVTVTGMSMGRLRDGKLVEGWNNWDTMSLMQQIGAFQPQATLVEVNT